MFRTDLISWFSLLTALVLMAACQADPPTQLGAAPNESVGSQIGAAPHESVAAPLPGPEPNTSTSPQAADPCLNPADPAPDAYGIATGPTDGQILLPNGRALTPTGDQIYVDTFPTNLIVSADGRYVYVTNIGKGDRSILQVDVASRQVTASLPFEHLFHGLALDATGEHLFAAGGEQDGIYVITLGDPGMDYTQFWERPGYPTGLALSPDGERLLVAENMTGEILEIEAATGNLLRTFETELMPYQVAYGLDGAYAYVSLWSRKEVAVLDLSRGKVSATLSTGRNPADLALSPDGALLYVASTDADLIEIFRTVDNRSVGQVAVGSFVAGLRGATPNAFALSGDGSRLYVANAGDNAVEVYGTDPIRYIGAVPVGWYPSALALAPDESTLFVLNAKGDGAGPNPDGGRAYRIMDGTLSFIPLPLSDEALEEGDQQVIANNTRPTELHNIGCEGKVFPIPPVDGTTPIEHVVYIMRENKTYDAYLGDLEVGDGDSSLTLFGEQITPNTHALARQFCLLDNFYTDSEDSDQGHLWATSAFANDYSERVNAAGRTLLTGVGSGSDSEGRYIFDLLLQAGIDWVNYGEVVGLEAATFKNLDMGFPGVFYNTNVKDQVKAEYVVSQIERGIMPPYTFLLLPNDHTNGTQAGQLTPESMISDNDYGVGLVVDAISKSEFWPTTVIFVFEDDPQTGADHVEAHRSPAIVISPWTKRGHVSSVQYSINSIHRSTELILDLPPMTQFDAYATPMYDCFTMTPDYTAYEVMPRQIEDSYNTRQTFGAEASARMDFSLPDRNPGLGRLLWRYRMGTEPPEKYMLDEEALEADDARD